MILIIGYGNPLRGDDGIGWHAAQQLMDEDLGDAVQVLACHQLTPELAELLGRSHTAIFIDAGIAVAPGELALHPVEPSATWPGSMSHHVNPAALLALAQALYGRSPQAFVLSVGGASFGAATGCSPLVEKSLPELIGRVRRLVEQARSTAPAR